MRGTRGVTLLALIVTIIVLLILAGLTINFVIGEQGIFNMSENAKEKHEIAQEKEQKDLNQLYSEMKIATNDNAQITVNIEDLKKIINNQVEEKIKELNLNNNAMGINENSILVTAVNATKAVGQYTLKNFTNQFANNSSEYFSYEDTTGSIICQKEGYYNMDLSLRAQSTISSSYLASYLVVYVNNIRMGQVTAIVNASFSEANDNNTITIYLKKGDKISLNKQIVNLPATGCCDAKLEIIKL